MAKSRGQRIALAAFCFLCVPADGGGRASEGAQANLTPRSIVRAQREIEAGRLQEGVELLRGALAIEPVADGDRAALHLTLARAEINLGRYARGLADSRSALRLYELLDDLPGQAEAHFRIATAHDELADYGASHRHNHLALELFRRLGDRTGEARALSVFGTSHRFLGDPRTALRYYSDAEAIFAADGNIPAVCFERRHVGIVLEDLGRFEEAEASYREALELTQGWDRGWARADLLFHLGRLAGRSGRAAEARPLLEEALELARSSQNAWAEAGTLVELARLRGAAGAIPPAVALAREGADLLRRMGAEDLEWEALHLLASLHDRNGELSRAAEVYREALELMESVRETVGAPLLRSRYTPRARGVYESLTRLQFRWPAELEPNVRAARMFATAERGRARGLAEMLEESRIAPAAPPGASDPRERALRGKINALRTRLSRFPGTVTDRDAVEGELFRAEQELAALRPTRGTDERIGGVTNDVDSDAYTKFRNGGHDVLAYQLGEIASFVWHLSPAGVSVFELPPRSEIENLVLFHRGLLVSRNDPEALHRAARRLSERILSPVARALDPARTLIVIPDGALFNLPFETLPLAVESSAGAHAEPYLIERHRLYYAPSLAVLDELARRSTHPDRAAGLELVAFGAAPPVGEEARLDHADSEVRRIATLFRKRDHELRTGGRATEAEFRRLVARPAAVVHLATHGMLDGSHPERSGLYLAANERGDGDGMLNVLEIFDLEIAADLVVLSGCETARGELVRGEGILGMSRAFLYAGAQAVVASLWRVDDRSTEAFMVAFYGRLRTETPVAEALRQTKLEWIESAPASRGDPFAWAAFILIGDGDRDPALRARRAALAWVLIAGGATLLLVASGGHLLRRN